MKVIICDKCKKDIKDYQWKAHLLYKQWHDDDGPKEIYELCSDCLDEVYKFIEEDGDLFRIEKKK